MTPLQRIRQKLFPDLEAMRPVVDRWKEQGQTIVFTNGCFDLLHPGHIDYLAKAASLGDKLIIGLNSDASVRRLKGERRPIQGQDARAMLLAGMDFTRAIVLFEEDTPASLIEAIRPDVLVKGGDYTVDQIAGADYVIRNGGSVILLPFLKGYSTSGIEKKILGA